MLNTFDALNETQEHRFHLELGMLKMVHAQRLLPIEQLLSGVAGGVPARSVPQPAGSRTSSGAPRPSPAISAPSPSPFGPAGSASAKQGASPVSVAEIEAPHSGFEVSSVPALTPAPFPELSAAALQERESPAEAGPARRSAAPEITAAPNMETLRLAVISALADAGHASAAQLLGAGSWALDGSSLRVEVAGIGKKMLSLTVNAAAEKIIRQELQRLGAPARFLIVPGEGSGAGAAPAPVPVAGSIQETALANPLVQRAKEIFKAEVRSVVDLRTK